MQQGWNVYIHASPLRWHKSRKVFYAELPCVLYPMEFIWPLLDPFIAEQLTWKRVWPREIRLLRIEAALVREDR